jgi:hypothetical protein
VPLQAQITTQQNIRSYVVFDNQSVMSHGKHLILNHVIDTNLVCTEQGVSALMNMAKRGRSDLISMLFESKLANVRMKDSQVRICDELDYLVQI